MRTIMKGSALKAINRVQTPVEVSNCWVTVCKLLIFTKYSKVCFKMIISFYFTLFTDQQYNHNDYILYINDRNLKII
jgi:hypothetical protein